MARKFPFKFDFNEDADPVEELHRLRVATAQHFKTLDAIMEYHGAAPTAREMIAELHAEIAENRTNAASSSQAKIAKKSAVRRKTAKRPVKAAL